MFVSILELCHQRLKILEPTNSPRSCLLLQIFFATEHNGSEPRPLCGIATPSQNGGAAIYALYTYAAEPISKILGQKNAKTLRDCRSSAAAVRNPNREVRIAVLLRLFRRSDFVCDCERRTPQRDSAPKSRGGIQR